MAYITEQMSTFAGDLKTFAEESELKPDIRQLIEWFQSFLENDLCPALIDLEKLLVEGDERALALRELFGEINNTKTIIVG